MNFHAFCGILYVGGYFLFSFFETEIFFVLLDFCNGVQ